MSQTEVVVNNLSPVRSETKSTYEVSSQQRVPEETQLNLENNNICYQEINDEISLQIGNSSDQSKLNQHTIIIQQPVIVSTPLITNNTTTTNNNKPNNTNNNNNNINEEQSSRHNSTHDSGEETEEENEVIEESSDGRWSKRNKKVNQNDIPAIDHSYVAMDTENGYEVVWNEIEISKKRCDKLNEPTLKQIFTNLMNINHPNIIKFHKYWEDTDKTNARRIVFITEYMPSGSLKQFLRKAKKTDQPIKRPTWRRWCVQLLTALHYLHNCEPPIVHRELSSDTVFIQQSGLIKVGCIAPDIVHTHVKTRDSRYMKSIEQFIAPELLDSNVNNINYGPPVDIYSFGMIALEMFNIELGGNGDTHQVTSELIETCINNLEDEKQKDFIRLCLKRNPNERPTAYQLLFHPLIFEFPSLKLLTSHKYVKTNYESPDFNFEYVISEYRKTLNQRNLIGVSRKANELIPQYSLMRATTQDEFVAFMIYDSNTSKKVPHEHHASINKLSEDLNKYLDDVKCGLYPIIVNLSHRPPKKLQQIQEEIVNNCQSTSQSNVDPLNAKETSYEIHVMSEKRRGQVVKSEIKDDQDKNRLLIILKFDDKTKRSIETSLLENDTPKSLTEDLIASGLICEINRDDLLRSLGDCLQNTRR